MVKTRPRVPIALPIAILVLLILGVLAGPAIRALATPEQLAANVLLGGIPFILIFVAIVLAFITLIVLLAGMLSNDVSPGVYRAVEWALIAGIVLGVIAMFQPWSFAAYRYGFLVLLTSTLGFILWSHIAPRQAERGEKPGSLAISEAEKRQGS